MALDGSPQALRDRHLLLSSFPSLKDLDQYTLRLLAERSKLRGYAPGHQLFCGNSLKREAFLVVEGAVLLSEGTATFIRRGPTVVGVVDFLSGRPTALEAKCHTWVKAFELPAKVLLETYRVSFSALLSTLRGIAQQVARRRTGLPASCPGPGRTEVPGSTPAQRVLRLRHQQMLATPNLDSVIDVSRIARDRRLSRGDALWHRGDESKEFVMVDYGTVACSNAVGESRVGSPHVLGLADAVLGQKRSFTARAENTVLVHEVPIESFFAVLETHFDLARSVLGSLAVEAVQQVDV